jgi:glycerol-3-phosphate O-acyltransferase
MVAPTGTLGETRLSFDDTEQMLSGFFGWEPGPLSRAAIKALSKVVVPLEHGSCSGHTLMGDPHRSSFVSAGPLTVFAMERPTLRRKIILAARLGHAGPLNVAAGGEASKKRRSRPWRKKAPFAMEELEALVFVQRRSGYNISVVPVVVTSHQHTPDAPAIDATAWLTSVSPLSLIRKSSALSRTIRTGRIKNARSLALAQWISESSAESVGEQVGRLRLELATRVESERRAVSGPPLEPARVVKLRVLSDPVLVSFMQRHALSEGIDPSEVMERAKEYIDEIASDYRAGVVRWFCRFVDFLFGRVLTGVDVDRRGLQFISECDIHDRIVLVCSHKSYADPLLIGYSMFRSGMVPPQQAAGLNLSFWPVGWLLRHSGAFYIRRSFAGETLYTEVFHAYTRYLLAGNHTIAVYAEGTRSRDGNLTRPKLGFLGAIEDALRMGVCDDVKLVPVYLGYDRVPEAAAHVKEMSGGVKVGESVSGFAGIVRSLNTKCGRGYVKFGEPVAMKASVASRGLDDTALEVCDRLNSVTPVSARSIAAAALLSSGAQLVPESEAIGACDSLYAMCEARDLPLTCTLEEVYGALDWLAGEGIIGRDDVDGFTVAGAHRRFLEYDKNVILGHFLSDCLTATAIKASGDVDEETAFLKRLLEGELVFPPEEQWLQRVERSMRRLAGSQASELDMLVSLIRSELQGYAVGIETARELDGIVPRDDLVKACFKSGEKMLRDGVIDREESLSRVTFQACVRMLTATGCLQRHDERSEGGKTIVMVEPGSGADLDAMRDSLSKLL